jgi:phosphoribosylaminoimidazolecarboxamide formyltransferase/IMP cyclohydrolase
MVAGSTLAIFGDWVMCNFCITAEIAEAMAKEGMSEGKLQKFDGVVANGFDNDALEFFRRKGDRCRCLVANRPLNQIFFDEAKFVRPTQGGDFIIQPNYGFVPNFFNGSVTVYGNLERSQVWDLVLADAICRTSNSNTITMVNDSMLIGNGVGQRSRVDAANLCVRLAHDAGHGGKIKGGAAASDSFFPFPDAPATLIGAGVKVIFSTSGSKIGDEAVAQLCANTGTVLVQLPDSQARGFCRH